MEYNDPVVINHAPTSKDTVSTDRHHRRSIRLAGYDYARAGAYFVTICTYNRKCHFGEIRDGHMILNQQGRSVEEEWLKTPVLRPSVSLDAFVVMPNHFHAILAFVDAGRGTARRAPTTERFGQPVSGSLATVIRAFKSAVTKRLNEHFVQGCPVWQRNYYEHVIRDEDSLLRIREYIATNPLRWALDRENPQRQGEDEFDRWFATFKTRPAKV